jgi:hypothetical protein
LGIAANPVMHFYGRPPITTQSNARDGPGVTRLVIYGVSGRLNIQVDCGAPVSNLNDHLGPNPQ